MARSEDFELFISSCGEASVRRPVPTESIERYQTVFPEALLKIWREEGWCGYSQGRFWTVNPDDYTGLVKLWLTGTPFERIDDYFVYAKTGFGVLSLWGKKNQRSIQLNCPLNAIVALQQDGMTPSKHPDLTLLSKFAMREPSDFDFEDEDGELLFDRAMASLGQLQENEIFGFEPALVAGGSPRIENVRKVREDVHLALLRDFSAPSVPFEKVSIPR